MKFPFPIYVINLDRSVDRLERIAAQMKEAGLSFHRIKATEPDAMPREYDAAGNRRHYLAPLSPGEIGCVLSHREAWRLVAEDREFEAAVILEDDAELEGTADDLRQAVESVAGSPHAELVKLYSLAPRKPRMRNMHRGRPLLPALTTTAQALNRQAARQLLRFTDSFYEPADVLVQRWWDHGVRVYSIDPPLFSEHGHHASSTIRIRGALPAEGRLWRELRRPLHQIRRLVRALAARVD